METLQIKGGVIDFIYKSRKPRTKKNDSEIF